VPIGQPPEVKRTKAIAAHAKVQSSASVTVRLVSALPLAQPSDVIRQDGSKQVDRPAQKTLQDLNFTRDPFTERPTVTNHAHDLPAIRQLLTGMPRSENPRTITWLHLSDLHSCKPKTGWDARRVLRFLRDDLQKMGESCGLTPNLIFFTGDAAFGQIGKRKGETLADQFDDAHSLLEEVRQAFHLSIPQSNVFLVPGNHDVDRGEVTEDQTDWLERQGNVATVTELIQNAGRQWGRYMDRLGAYKAFLQQRGYKHLLGAPDQLIYAQTREVCGVKIGIAGFNSAWSCCRDREKGKLWLGGDWQVGELTSQLNEADFSIALIHHPLNWFVEQEDPTLWRLIEREFAFCLHGHEHQGWVDERSDGHTRIAAAACYERSNLENGYNFVRLSLETGLGEVWLRRFEPHGGAWVQRIIARKTDDLGMWPLRHLTWLKHFLAGGEPTSTGRTDSAIEAGGGTNYSTPRPSAVRSHAQAAQQTLPSRDLIYISYSHKDKQWHKQLRYIFRSKRTA
jgi:predicted MPP superfamily phosphohydrolase